MNKFGGGVVFNGFSWFEAAFDGTKEVLRKVFSIQRKETYFIPGGRKDVEKHLALRYHKHVFDDFGHPK